MSDDLISRKALLDRFRYGDKEFESDKAWICAVRRMIKEQPTAFDKEKVINEIHISSAGMAVNMNVCSSYAEGYIDAAKDIIEIVEKGGIG